MTTRVKRKRGRPRRTDRPAAELPAVPEIVTAPASPAEALAALDTAAAPSLDAGDESPEPERADAAADSLDRSHDSPPAAPYAITDEPAASKPRDASRPRERSELTGRAFGTMKRVELQTALRISERENAQLRAEIEAMPPQTTAEKAQALEKMCAVVCSALFDLAALATDVEEVRLDREEEQEIGELGAPAIGPYLGQYAKHAPLLAFGAKLATVITTKVLTVKAARAEQRAGVHRAARATPAADER